MLWLLVVLFKATTVACLGDELLSCYWGASGSFGQQYSRSTVTVATCTYVNVLLHLVNIPQKDSAVESVQKMTQWLPSVVQSWQL